MATTAYLFFGTPLKPTRINLRTRRLFLKALNDVVNKNYTKLVVSITSEGGFCEDGFNMYHALRQVADCLDVETHGVSDCTSMAGVIHMAGDVRTSAPATIFGLHSASCEDIIDPNYNSRLIEVYEDRAGWRQNEISSYLNGIDLAIPTLGELYNLKILTQSSPRHVSFNLATHTII